MALIKKIGTNKYLYDDGADNIDLSAINTDVKVYAGGSGSSGDPIADTDRIKTGAGNDFIDGGEGRDVINSGAGNDTVHGGAGNDVVDGSKGDDVVNGGTGNDIIFGASKIGSATDNDTLTGGEGHDAFWFANAGVGNDTITDWGSDDLIAFLTGRDYSVAQDGANSVITMGDGSGSITVLNTEMCQLNIATFDTYNEFYDQVTSGWAVT